MTLARQLLAKVDLKEFVWSFFSRIASPLLSFAVLLMASRTLSIEEYGLYNFLFSVGSSVGLVLVLGQNVLLMKHFRTSPDTAEEEANRTLLAMNFRWIASGIAVALLVAGAIQIFAVDFPHHYDALPIAFVFSCVFALSEYFQYYFRVRGNIGLALTPRENIWRILTLAAFPVAAYTGFMTTGARAMEVTTVLLALVVGYQAIRMVGIEGRVFLRSRRVDMDAETRSIWSRESLFFTANAFFVSAALYLETILIGIFLSLEAAAFYFVAFRLAALLMLPVSIIDTIGIPMVSARLQARDIPGAQHLISVLSAGSFAGTLLAFCFMIAIGKLALSLFEPSFADHYAVLVVLCLSPVAHAFFGPGTNLMMIGGGERYFLWMRSLIFVVYIAALILFGVYFGMIGIAVVGLVHSFVILLLCRNWTLAHVGVDNMATTVIAAIRHWRGRGGPEAAGERSDG
ncbi:lipopolysaccharide biosynthesis protein [Microvirga tunisiensis]|uniref:Lipopolysaccharide biosynthesis protein n=1 Tax=Pannonibacter tanglangensis TaxID=2750084 RepID=A0A7X5F456_9HYPH|nr:lipopolysaccharide biosynthesis protein [Pannonibacter sp. XCT-53]NBN79401.1 lipopolysaccharide biosynthesis protein [Pannonibacter sp. XCT-53]